MSRPTLQAILLVPTISTLVLRSLPVSAYIPALPVNDTTALNLTDSSTISIAWQNPAGVYSGAVSYQLKADVPTNGTTSGALVHFAESTMGMNLTTDTPWIAYISCDVNETGASQEWAGVHIDIAELPAESGVHHGLREAVRRVRDEDDAGRKASTGPRTWFAPSAELTIGRVIDNLWTHTNDTFYTYNGTLLNESGADVNLSLAGATLSTKTYLVGTLVARNSTGQATTTDIPSASSTPTSVASTGISASMIALYVIVSIVGTLFITMLVLGWRRARMHPERYGRRDEGDGQGAQTVAKGLGQAILDTFPVIKFRGNGEEREFAGAAPKRIESEQNIRSIVFPESNPPLPLGSSQSITSHQQHRGESRQSMAMRSLRSDETSSFHSALEGDDYSLKSGGPSRIGASAAASRRASGSDLNSAMGIMEEEQEGAGLQQCPICLLDFEEGEDLRVLPCERKHVYHQGCIDPWLLQVSGSCPLCRKDFNNPAVGAPSTDSSQPSTPTTPSHLPMQSGFARYLAFMRRERRGIGRRRAGTAASGSGSGRTAEGGAGGGERMFGRLGNHGHGHGEGEQGGPGGY